MSATAQNRHDPWDLVPGVVDEPRDARSYSEVVLPFVARTDGFILQGTKFSIGGFELLQEATDVINGDQVLLDHRAFALKDQPFQLRINLSGFVLELGIRAGFVGTEGDGPDRRLLFAITEISAREEQALRRVIRAYLNGQIANADDVMRAMDEPTGFGKPKSSPAPIKPQRSFKPQIIAGMASILCALVITLSLISIYDRFMIIESKFAAVTAPRVDIRSAGAGLLKRHAGAAGSSVARDAPLFTIENAELNSEIELSRARIAFLEAARERATMLTRPEEVSALYPSQIEALQKIAAKSASLEVLEDEISLEIGRLKAFELRQAALEQFSPCDCRVIWAAEPESWLETDMPVVTLAKSQPEDLRVEALMLIEEAMAFEPGQSAFVRPAGTTDLVPATVEHVLLDARRRPRAGFPAWLRNDHALSSVILTVEEELSADDVGVPVDVFVTDNLPLREQLKRLLGL